MSEQKLLAALYGNTRRGIVAKGTERRARVIPDSTGQACG